MRNGDPPNGTDGLGSATTGLSFEPLRGHEVAMAYTLVRELTPEVSLEQWQTYVAALAGAPAERSGNRGLIAARTAAGYMLGLCCYRVELDLRDGLTLRVDDVVVPGMLGQRQITAGLFQAIEALAKESGCAAVHISCPVNISWLFQLARHKDYWRCRWRFCKRL